MEHKKLVIIGASGHGKVCAEIAVRCGFEKILFLDDDSSLTFCGRYPVAGTVTDSDKYIETASFFTAIGNSHIRERIMRKLEEDGGEITTLVHPDAVISESAVIGYGSVVMAGAVINADAIIGKGCIINTAASVDHDCVVEDYCHISVGSHLAGTVHTGKHTWIGAGAVVSNNVTVCGECMIGAGAVVVRDINEIGTYVGIPAKRMDTMT